MSQTAPASGACSTGKLQYANRKQAKIGRRRTGDSSLSLYRCPECDWIHLGHMLRNVRNGTYDKADWLERLEGR